MNQNVKTKRPFPYVAVSLIAVAVLIVAVLLFTLLDTIGVVGKLDTAVKSDNYTVNGNELAVYEYQATLSNLANQFWYYQYGLMQDTYGYTKMFPDAYSFAYAMLPSYMGAGMYESTAYEYAQQYVVYCEAAKAAGVTLDEEDRKELEDYITGLKETAEALDMRFQAFINTYIGSGISEKEIRSAMELSLLGSKYAEIKYEEFSDATTEDELKDYRDQNKSSFYKHYYNSYVLVSDKLAQKEIDGKPNPLYVGDCTTVDEIKEILAKYMVDTNFDKLYKDKIENNKDITDTNGKDTTKEMVLETLLASIFPAVEDEKEEDKKEDGKTEDTETETGDETETEAGTVPAAETEDKTEEKKYTTHFTSADTDAYKKACYQIMTSIKSSYTTEANKISVDAAAAWMDLSDTTSDTYKNATEVQKWLFDAGRKEGEKNVVKTEKTSTNSSTGATTTTTTYTWIVVNKTNALDEEKTKDAYYLTLTDDKKTESSTGASTEAGTGDSTELKTGKVKAEEFFKALEEAVKKEDFDFDKLAIEHKYLAEGGTALQENLSKKNLATVLGDWLYEEGREKGNIKMLNNGTTYYVVYFVEENEETWKMNARNGVASEKINGKEGHEDEGWFNKTKAQYNVVVDYEFETENHEGHDHD